jgi:hypothetical protein
MLSCSTVYDLLISQIRADGRGLALSPAEFNRFAPVVNERMYAKYLETFETNTDTIGALAGFKVLNSTVALVSGVGSLPSNYYQLIGKPRTLDSLGVTRRVELVSSLELDERLDDYLTQPTATHPCAILGSLDASDNVKIHLYPTTIANVYVDYLKSAVTPFLDYYVNNTTYVVTHMAASATVSVPSGSTYRTGTAGGGAGIVSQTVNFEWSTSDLALIISMFCQMIGLAIPDADMITVATADEIKNE